MLNTKSFLTVDFGAANLKVAEFELTEAGGLILRDYAFQSMGQEGSQEATRETAMEQALQQLLAQKSWRSKNINVCAPGFHTFSKFVKLPPVDTSKVTQIIQYEAQQNVPFPLEEVVWDYQILGAAPSGELEVMLVAIKSDVVEGIFRVSESVGLRMQLVDASPAALCNAFRYNYGDLEGCTMLLDIGAKTSNLLFFDKGNVYARSINIGAIAITQDFAKEARLSFGEAERLKIEEGFVSLGGAYEEPENANQAAISKIARQVLTRLHIQVNQTVQFYRGQQGGAAPDRLFLSGGAAIMPYSAQFFAEKLSVPVEYFNPFRNVEIDPALDLEELAKVAHSQGEVVGLALRNLAHCPVELNLMPKSSLSKQRFGQKKPYLIAGLACLALIIFGGGLFYSRMAAQKQSALEDLQAKNAPLVRNEREVVKAKQQIQTANLALQQMTGWLDDKFYWAKMLSVVRKVLLEVENTKKEELKADVGVWVERLIPKLPTGYLPEVEHWELPARASAEGGQSGLGSSRSMDNPDGFGAGPGAQGQGQANMIEYVKLYCRGVNRSSVAPAANNQIAYAFVAALKEQADWFDPAQAEAVGKLEVSQDELTFGFEVIVKLKRSIEL